MLQKSELYTDAIYSKNTVETVEIEEQQKAPYEEKNDNSINSNKINEDEYQEVDSSEILDEIENNALDIKAFKGKLTCDEKLDEVISVFGYEEVFDAIDEDGNGQISADELEKMGLESDISKLTADDIRMIAKKAGIPVDYYLDEEDTVKPNKETKEDKDKDDKNVKDNENDSELSDSLLQKLKDSFLENSKKDAVHNSKTNQKEQAAPLAERYQQAVDNSSAGVQNTGGGYYNAGNSSVGYSPAANNVQNSTSKPDAMSMEQLLADQKEKQNAVNDASKEVSDVQNDTNKNVKAAKDDEKTKKEDYEKKLKEDENVSKKLKDDKIKIEKDIAAKEKEIKAKETAITKAENEIYNLENTVSNLDSQISSLKASLGALPAKTEENKNRHAEIDAKKTEIEGKIKTAEADKKKATEKKTKLENQKKKDEKELEQLNADLEKLNLKRDDNEQKIMNNASENTKLALEAYQKARTNVETTKASELQKAQKNLDDAKAGLDKVNASINELQSMQMQLENRVGSEGEDVVEFAQKLDGLSAAEMKEIMRAAGCQFDDGAWCADFVTYVTKQVYGNDATPGDFAKSCSNTAYCPTIMDWAQQKGVWTSNSGEVQPGDYILYSRNGRAGHIGIVTSVNPDGSVNTVEGNTSDDNGHYSAGVVNQHHNVTSAMGYVLMSKLAA